MDWPRGPIWHTIGAKVESALVQNGLGEDGLVIIFMVIDTKAVGRRRPISLCTQVGLGEVL
jgi:hypothetical protein